LSNFKKRSPPPPTSAPVARPTEGRSRRASGPRARNDARLSLLLILILPSYVSNYRCLPPGATPCHPTPLRPGSPRTEPWESGEREKIEGRRGAEEEETRLVKTQTGSQQQRLRVCQSRHGVGRGVAAVVGGGRGRTRLYDQSCCARSCSRSERGKSRGIVKRGDSMQGLCQRGLLRPFAPAPLLCPGFACTHGRTCTRSFPRARSLDRGE
jgi:hypothetical protein